MAPKRRAVDAAANGTEEAKKYKSAIDGMADEWICPITTELAFDPVLAEDGQMYERSAIEELIQQQGQALKSPMTNLPMGPRLTPSTQARNTIEKLVRSGAIGGDKVERWLERLSQEDLVKATKQRAEGGCTDAMWDLCHWYELGEKGLTEDDAAAFRWAKMGADLDDPRCLAICGTRLFVGLGTDENEALGLCLRFQAAALGSKRGAMAVADAYWIGVNGILPKDRERAKHWYRKVATNELDDLSDFFVQLAAERAA